MREREGILRTLIHYVHFLLCELSRPARSTCFYISEIDQMNSREHSYWNLGVSLTRVCKITWNWKQWSFSTETDASSREAGQGSRGGEESRKPGSRIPRLRTLPVEHKPSPEQGWAGE